MFGALVMRDRVVDQWRLRRMTKTVASPPTAAAQI